jgi:hypothetical protein
MQSKAEAEVEVRLCLAFFSGKRGVISEFRKIVDLG